MLLGNTGVGKSTLANAFIKGPKSIVRGIDGKYNFVPDTEDDGDTVFKIGHGAVS